MKIKLSKAQWELIGKKTGWIKEVQSATTQKKECHKCHGIGAFEGMPCSMCNGKGHITKEDSDSYYHSMGVGPCPHKKAQTIPDDGIADGGTPYTEEEMDLIESKKSKKAKIDAIKNNNNRTEKLLKLLELYFSTYPKTTGEEVKTFWNNIAEMSLEDMNKYIDNFVSRW